MKPSEFLKILEKVKSPEFSKVDENIQAIFDFFGYELDPELKAYVEENMVIDTSLSSKEQFEYGCRLAQKFFSIKQRNP